MAAYLFALRRLFEPNDKAPIILLHDSLGSVELWRNFSLALCQATGRQVVAANHQTFFFPVKLEGLPRQLRTNAVSWL